MLLLLLVLLLVLFRDSPRHGGLLGWLSSSSGPSACTRGGVGPAELLGIYGSLPSIPSLDVDALELCPAHLSLQSPTASVLFRQGLLQMYGFNYDEARLNFRAALEADGQCTLCHFGLASTYHPHLNSPLSLDNARLGRAVVESRLQQLSSSTASSAVCALELRLLQAQLRLLSPATWNTTATTDYRVALAQIVDSFGGPPAKISAPRLLRVWLAESIMNESPWLYLRRHADTASSGSSEHELLPGATQALDLLRGVVFGLEHFAHPLALHLMIHICEQSDALAATDGLRAAKLLSAAMQQNSSGFTGHLVHMPAHIFTRVGAYAQSLAASRAALQVDAHYAARCLGAYAPAHNVALLVMAALYAGEERLALEHAPRLREVVRGAPAELEGRALYLTALFPTPAELVLARFGRWAAIPSDDKGEGAGEGVGRDGEMGGWALEGELRKRTAAARRARGRRLGEGGATAAPLPPFVRAMQVYAQSLRRIHLAQSQAQSQTQAEAEAEAEADAAQAAMSQAASRIPPDAMHSSHVFYPNHVELGAIMNATVAAAVAVRRGRFALAVGLLEAAAKTQDAFAYMEPENWHVPLAQCIAAVHLASAEAEAGAGAGAGVGGCSAARLASLRAAVAALGRDLRQHPHNVWALQGLALARSGLRACGNAGADGGAQAEGEWTQPSELLPLSPCCEVTGCGPAKLLVARS